MRDLRRDPIPKTWSIHHPVLGVDIEDREGIFYCAHVYGKYKVSKRVTDGKKRVRVYHEELIDKHFNNKTEFHKFLLSIPEGSCFLAFFNLGYDSWHLLEIRDDAQTIRKGSKIIKMILKGNGILCLDLCNHVDGSLEHWINELNMIQWGITKESLSNPDRRCENDAKATFRLGVMLEDFYFNELGIPMMMTASAAALKHWRRYFFQDYWHRTDKEEYLNEFEHKALYGGRVEVHKRGIQHVYKYDINKAYLSVMHDEYFPDMQTAVYHKSGRSYKRYLNSDYLGIYHVRVEVPKSQKIPVLPTREPDGRIMFKTGELEGYWTNVHLQEALKHGTKILKCFEFIHYGNKKKYFEKWAECIWNKYNLYKNKNMRGMELFIKKIGNSVYGKFAQMNTIDSYYGKPEDASPEIIERFKQEKHTTVQMKDGSIVWDIPGKKAPARHEFSAVSAFITAYQQVRLHRVAIQYQSQLVYMDTDCVRLLSPATKLPISNKLGEWKFEGEETLAYFNAKNVQPGTLKGIPKRARLLSLDYVHACILAGIKPDPGLLLASTGGTANKQIWYWTRPYMEKEAVKQREVPNSWHVHLAEISLLDDKRRWTKNGDSLPHHVPRGCLYVSS